MTDFVSYLGKLHALFTDVKAQVTALILPGREADANGALNILAIEMVKIVTANHETIPRSPPHNDSASTSSKACSPRPSSPDGASFPNDDSSIEEISQQANSVTGNTSSSPQPQNTVNDERNPTLINLETSAENAASAPSAGLSSSTPNSTPKKATNKRPAEDERPNLSRVSTSTAANDFARIVGDIAEALSPKRQKVDVNSTSSSASEAPHRYKCDLCGKEYIYHHAFRTHARLHDDVLPFTCTFPVKERSGRERSCDHIAKSKSAIAKHIKEVHHVTRTDAIFNYFKVDEDLL